jgi:hypothetical protein
MSFFGDMAGKEIGSMTNSSNPLVASVMQMINNQPGGLPDCCSVFTRRGWGARSVHGSERNKTYPWLRISLSMSWELSE